MFEQNVKGHLPSHLLVRGLPVFDDWVSITSATTNLGFAERHNKFEQNVAVINCYVRFV